MNEITITYIERYVSSQPLYGINLPAIVEGDARLHARLLELQGLRQQVVGVDGRKFTVDNVAVVANEALPLVMDMYRRGSLLRGDASELLARQEQESEPGSWEDGEWWLAAQRLRIDVALSKHWGE